MRRTFFRPERPTLTSRSLQSITRPFQKRFREVFGNAGILIFYLSIKAWEEKSLPKSHLGLFFLVFGEGKATKKISQFFGSVTFKVFSRILKIKTSRKASFYHFSQEKIALLPLVKERLPSPNGKMIKLLTFVNLFSPLRHSR